MNMSSYKYGLPLPGIGNVPYYDPYEVHNYAPRMDMNRSAWEYPVMMNVTESATTDVQSAENSVPSMQAIPEECQFLFLCFQLQEIAMYFLYLCLL